MKYFSRAGYTLMEALVGLGLLAIIMVSVSTFYVNSLKITNDVNNNANRMQEIQDGVGYLGDNIRRAALINSSLTVNGASCALTDAQPCFAILVPSSSGLNGQQIDTLIWMAYRLEIRSAMGPAYRQVNAWEDSNTRVIREYRSPLCDPDTSNSTPVCPTVSQAATATMPEFISGIVTGPPTSTVSISGATPYLVMDRVYVTPLSSIFNFNAATQTFTLNLRIATSSRNTVEYTPPNVSGTQQTFSIQVQTRNAY